MNSQRRAFLLFLLLAVTGCWGLSLTGQRKARSMQNAAALQVARSRHFEPRGATSWALVEADGTASKFLTFDAKSPDWYQALSTEASADLAPPEAAPTVLQGPAQDLLELRLAPQVRLIDTRLAVILEFKIPEGSESRSSLRLSPGRDMALACTGLPGSAEISYWFFSQGSWKLLAQAGCQPLGDSLKASPSWNYLGFEARNAAGEPLSLAADSKSLNWQQKPGWSLVSIDDDSTVHLAQTEKLDDWKLAP